MPVHSPTDVDIPPVRQPPTHRVVADAIRNRLALGEIRPGDRLPSERALAERLGVGRMTVRQALHDLAAEGLLVTRRGRHGGTVVVDEPRPTPPADDATARYGADLRENYEFRATFEPAVARLAARRAGPAAVRDLCALAAETATSVARYRAIDSRFHLLLAHASENRYAVDAVTRARASLFAWADALWGGEDWERHAPTVQASLAEHVRIADAVAAGDGASAEQAMEAHLRTASAAFSGIIDDVGAAGRPRPS
jgi:DNA-binding FadR family transcriptional regulator